MNQRGNREETLFHAALELEPDKRAGYLALACGSDEALRHRIEVLLAAEAEADPFFQKDPMQAALGEDVPGAPALVLPGTEKPGDQIGHYKLLQQIGEGGCGVVYMAEQEEPVRRRVALKVIRLGMDTKQVIARFEAERQALAMMDHPNIAKIYDAGVVGEACDRNADSRVGERDVPVAGGQAGWKTGVTGRPYFAMELVRGTKITEYCDQHQLSTGERLGLFVQVCHAVQHAHQKGIIHRDLKPSNILVSLHDGVPVPVVIDFGIAKATERRLTDKTLFTAFEQFIGTPAYTSPEQAEMSRIDIDTRSDIYSLGVLLYELLTGRTPFDTQALLAAGLDEMRRMIREQEPTRPSTRLATLQGEELTTTAKRRSADAPRLIHLLKGDLDWIVMKCLEKDRTRRYETANGLAMDIQRHLNHEPVVARPPTAAYRFQKAWKRNRVVFLAGSMVLLALCVGGAASVWLAVMAGKARRVADRQREVAEAAMRRAEREENETRRWAYAADMNLAHLALRMDNLGRAWDLLNRHRPEPGREDLRGWEWRYLWGQCQSDASFPLCRLPDFDAAVSVAMSPAGNLVAIGGDQGSGVEVRDLSTGVRVARLAFGEPFAHVAFSPDGRRLAYSTTGKLRVWDCAARATVAEAQLHGDVVSLAFSGDGQILITFQPNQAVTLWRASNLESLRRLPVPEGHARLGNPFAVSPDLKTVVVVNKWDGLIVLSLESGRERWRTNSTSLWSQAMAISPDGARLAASFGPGDGTIHLWELATGAPLGRLPGHRAWVSALKFRPDGKTLVSASADRTIRIWDLEQGKAVRVLHGHKHEIWSLDWGSNPTTLLSGDKQGEVLVWDTSRDLERRSAWALTHSLWSWSFSTDGRAIHAVEQAPEHLSQSLQSSSREPTEGQAIDAFARKPGRLLRCQGPSFDRTEVLPDVQFNGDFAFSPSGRLFVGSMTNGVLRVWDLDERIRTYEFSTGARISRPVAFSKDETRVWLLQGDEANAGGLVLAEWELRSQRRLCSIQGVRDRYLTLHPDDWVFWQADGRPLVFYDLKRGQESHPAIAAGRLAALHGYPSASPDGSRLVLSHDLGVLTVWATASLTGGTDPRKIKELGGIRLAFSDSFFTPDGKRLMGGAVGTEAIKIWDTHAFHELLTLEAEGTHFHHLGLSPDGRLLGALDGAGILHLWSAPSWQEIEASEKAEKGALSE